MERTRTNVSRYRRVIMEYTYKYPNRVQSINGGIFGRIGEVMVNIPLSQFTVSDLEIADPSVSGFFPLLYTVKLQDHPDDSSKTIALLTYTMLGVAHPWALGVLAYQANSVK